MAAKGINSPWQEQDSVISLFSDAELELRIYSLYNWNSPCEMFVKHCTSTRPYARLKCRGTAIKASNKAFCTRSTCTWGWDFSHTASPDMVPISFPHVQLQNSPCQQADNVFRGTELHSDFITRRWKMCPQTRSYWSCCE